jgi:cyanate permease
VIFVILIYYVFLLLPFGLFLAAAVAEIRSYQKGPAFFLRMVEIVAGIIGVLAIPSKSGAHRLFLPGHCPISANLRTGFSVLGPMLGECVSSKKAGRCS